MPNSNKQVENIVDIINKNNVYDFNRLWYRGEKENKIYMFFYTTRKFHEHLFF